MQNSIFIAQESSQYSGKKYSFWKQGLTKTIFRILIKSILHIFRFCYFHGGLIKNKFSYLSKSIFSCFSICWYLSFIIIYHIFDFYYYFPPWARTLVVYAKIINWNYLLQQSRNPFYHLRLLIHHLLVISQEHISFLDLILNTSLSIISRSKFQI